MTAVRHVRAVMAEIRRLRSLPEEELFITAKEVGAPFELVKWVADDGRVSS